MHPYRNNWTFQSGLYRIQPKNLFDQFDTPIRIEWGSCVLPPANEHPAGQSRRDSSGITPRSAFAFANMGARSAAIVASNV